MSTSEVHPRVQAASHLLLNTYYEEPTEVYWILEHAACGSDLVSASVCRHLMEPSHDSHEVRGATCMHAAHLNPGTSSR